MIILTSSSWNPVGSLQCFPIWPICSMGTAKALFSLKPHNMRPQSDILLVLFIPLGPLLSLLCQFTLESSSAWGNSVYGLPLLLLQTHFKKRNPLLAPLSPEFWPLFPLPLRNLIRVSWTSFKNIMSKVNSLHNHNYRLLFTHMLSLL